MTPNGSAPQPLDVGIVGAGLAGLSAAIALRRSGHTVTIFERSSFKNGIGAAVSIPPNATRILDRWAFDWPKARPEEKKQIRMVDARTLEVTYQDSFEDVEALYGSRWWSVHRVDMHGELRRMATGEGVGEPVRIRLGSGVVGLDADNGVLTLADGETVQRDLVVVADGTHSGFLKEIAGRDVPMIRTGQSAYRSLVSMEKAMEIPKIRELFEGELPGFFIPVGRNMVRNMTYPCRDGTLLNWAVIHPTKEKDQGKDSANWNHSAAKEDVLQCLEGFHPAWRELCMNLEEVKYFTVMFHEPLERISRGKAVLIGDAAHPMLPTHGISFLQVMRLCIVLTSPTGQGAAMAYEEAAALEVIFGPGTARDEVEKRLDVFQKVCLPRGMVTQIMPNMWYAPREVMEKGIAKIDPCAVIPPPGSMLFNKHIRGHFYPYDSQEEARKALELARIA